MTRKRTAAVAIVCLMAGTAGAAATFGTEDTAGPRRAPAPATLTVLHPHDLDTVDPGSAWTATDLAVALATQRPLFVISPCSCAYVPDLAAEPARASNGGRVVTVRIRRGVRFSGAVEREVTAKDVRYGILRALRPPIENADAMRLMRDLGGIRTPDRYTLRFQLRRPSAGSFAHALALPITAPVPVEVGSVHDTGDWSTYSSELAFTGPYVIDDDDIDVVTLVRNRGYQGPLRRAGTPQRIVLRARKGGDAAIARAALKGTATVTMGTQVPEEVVAEDEERLAHAIADGLLYTRLKSRSGPLRDIRLRSLAAATIYEALEREPEPHLLPPFLEGHRTISEAGPAAPAFVAVGSTVARSEAAGRTLRVAGPRYEVEWVGPFLERSGFTVRALAARRGSCPKSADVCLALEQRGVIRDAAGLIHVVLGEDLSAVGDPKLVALFERARAATDPVERESLWAAVATRVTASALAVPHFWFGSEALLSDGVRAVIDPLSGAVDLRSVRIEARERPARRRGPSGVTVAALRAPSLGRRVRP